MKKKVVIICVGQPSTNPRTVKEAMALSDAGYEVTVIYNYCAGWADKTDREIFNNAKNVRWILAGSHPRQNKFSYFFSRVNYKINTLIAAKYPDSIFWQQKIESRHLAATKRTANKNIADLYIAHNLGALPAAAEAARINKSLYAFDAEDYHRGQVEEASKEWKRAVLLEDHYLRGVSYIVAGSKLIAEQYKHHYPLLSPDVIYNVFSKAFAQRKSERYSAGQVLKLFWVSQTVGRDRGIENIVKAMGILRDYKIQCTLLGNASDEMRKHFVEVAQHSGLNADQLIFVNPVSLTEMFKIGAQHHIGMATEPGHNENNRRALSNKIFSYLLSGLAIVASNTPAQLSFINEYPSVGCYYNRDSPEGLAAALESYLKNPDQLDEARNYALHLATTTLNWENESKKIVAIVETVLGKDSFRKAGKTVTAV